MIFVVAPVVESYGDVNAVPILLRMIAPQLLVARPVRQGRGVLTSREGLIRAVRIAAANIRGQGAVLVIFDADRDCAAELANNLKQWLSEGVAHIPCGVALAVRGFESWIVGGDAFYGVENPDHAADVKGSIEARYQTYKKTVDQPRHIAKVDLNRLHQNSRSFRHLHNILSGFVAASTEDSSSQPE